MAHKRSIFSDFLTALGVSHTRRYSDRRFRDMTFKSLFGLSRLLDEYGVPNAGWQLPEERSVVGLPLPCLVQRKGVFLIVTSATPTETTYIYKGERKSLPTKDFEQGWSGVVMTAKPGANSREPSYLRHRILDFASAALTWVMVIAIAVVAGYLYVTRGFYHSIPATLILAVDAGGLTVTSMLMLKSLNVHTAAADRVCGILQHGGCDKILATDASRFFGLFGWSEVGMGYFLVSTATLLLFPSYIHFLAIANICCLPFSFWSIWYQRFKAHHWCTLCVITQGLLWCQFFCNLAGGFITTINLATPAPWILLCCYVATVLMLDKTANTLKEEKP